MSRIKGIYHRTLPQQGIQNFTGSERTMKRKRA